MTQKQNKGKTTKKKLSKGAIVLIVGIIIIAIPLLVFGGIIAHAALQIGKPILGSRFDNDLNPGITNSQTGTVKSSIKAISGVEDCEVVMTSAQYRVNVDVDDSLSSDQIKDLSIDVYNAVNNTLPVSTYFTATDSMKMYDLSINVYNFVDADNENMIYYIVTKNSTMDKYSLQCVSEPVDEQLAKELRGETDIPTGTGDATVEENPEGE